MENEQHYYELRSGSRSRSRTPLVQSHTLIESGILEHHYDLRSRSRERSHTPGEVTSTRRSVSKSLPSSSKTNDQSMETKVESKKEVITEITSEDTNKRVENSVVGTKKGERRSERQKVKRQIFANGQTEKKEDSRKREKVQKNTSDYSSEEGEKEDLSNRPSSAHEFYKQAGEWWNVFPKTDYTYSEGSQCRYEIAPGILAMPNMSRRSIHSSGDTVNQCSLTTLDSGIYESTEKEKGTGMDEHTSTDGFYGHTSSLDKNSKIQYTKMHVEQYCTHREAIYTKPRDSTKSRSRESSLLSNLPYKRIDSQKCNVTNFIDSDTELDEVFSASNHSRRNNIIQRITSFTIVLWFIKLLEFLRFRRVEKREYYATYEFNRNESKISRIWKSIIRSSQYLYFFLVRVFLFDTWLLSRLSNVRRRMQQRKTKILWFIGLPLFLLIGCWCFPYLSTLPLPNLLFNKDVSSEQLDESGQIWSKCDNEMLLLEKELKEPKLVNTQEIDGIKLQFERLKEHYTELKLCCNSHIKYVTSEEFEKRMRTYFDMITSKTAEIKVQDESSIVMDGVLTDDRVREIVKEAIKIYDADKTGRVDYALESAGGQIISTRCTQQYDINSRVFKLLAFTLYHENNNPRTVIQGNTIQPGTCWAFQGFPGYLLIKLRSFVYVTGFTVEHAPKSILPNGEMRSAPKKFNVWGFLDENDSEPVMFGDYEFVASDDSLQYFPVQNSTINIPYGYVELRIHSNHGELEYTCLYRFRVHGRPI